MSAREGPDLGSRIAGGWPVIRKSPATLGLAPNLPDYDAFRREFRWENARAQLDGLPGGGINIAYEAVDRHLAHGRGGRLAIRWLGKNGEHRDITYAELAARSDRFAALLSRLGIGKGDAVFCLTGRIPELYVAALGSLKNGSLFSPLFSAFGPEPIETRMRLGGAKVLVTTSALYRKKVESWRARLPSLQQVLIVDDPAPAGTISLAAALSAESGRFALVRTEAEDPALLHFTSGTCARRAASCLPDSCMTDRVFALYTSLSRNQSSPARNEFGPSIGSLELEIFDFGLLSADESSRNLDAPGDLPLATCHIGIERLCNRRIQRRRLVVPE